jgi:FKBP-type peptidyl-prolyl cis-trans isomerase (trigger factor)
MISAIQKSEDNTITLTITIPAKRVEQAREEMIEEFVKTADIKGFRKGKAPRKLVEQRLDPEKLKEEILKKLLPQTYVEAIQENKVNPIMSPQIHVQAVEDGKDWQYVAVTCETPNITLGDYKKKVKDATAKQKIALPGKEAQPVSFDEIVKILLENTTVQIPAILLTREADRLLSQTLDEIKKLGLTLDQYLASTKKTPEQLRKDYEEKAANDLKFELILQKIADTENITVEEKEIEEAIVKAKDDAERKT